MINTVNTNTTELVSNTPNQAPKETPSVKIPSQIESQQRLDAQIIENLSISIDSKNKPQSILYSAAIDEINKLLNQAAGNTELTTQNILEQKLAEDNSSEATAERILSFALGAFQRYADQNPNLEGEALAERFVSVMRGGFEKGYNEATDILKSLQVFKGDIETDIQKTYTLVNQGFDNFLASFKASSGDQTAQ